MNIAPVECSAGLQDGLQAASTLITLTMLSDGVVFLHIRSIQIPYISLAATKLLLPER